MIRTLIILALCALPVLADVTPADYLASQTKPNFAVGHHLPHLVRYGWATGISSNTAVELANNWGYTFQVDLENLTTAQLKLPPENGWIAMVSNNPTKYALSVQMDIHFPTPVNDGFYCTNSAGWFVDNTGTNSWQYATNTAYTKVYSPEAPDDYLTLCASNSAWSLAVLQSNAPISIVVNGGEYGLGVRGSDRAAWEQDPRVQAATNGLSWSGYSSKRKAHQLGFYSAAVRSLLPNRELYIFYNTGGEQVQYSAPSGAGSQTDMASWWNNSYWGWWSSELMGTNLAVNSRPTSDLPSFENYYNNADSFTNINGVGYNFDLLTRYLNSVGCNLTLGYTNNYSWLCGGYQRSTNLNYSLLADIPTYTGFLKCLYTGGMLGGTAGYYYYPDAGGYGTAFGGPGFDAAFPSNTPPHWLLQLMATSHAHALFSHLEPFLTNGDLLTGSGQLNIMSKTYPAYEFTNTVADPYSRVVVRKMRGTNQWIVTAWNSNYSTNNVTVTIPTLGTVTVAAIPSATVYQAWLTNSVADLQPLDEYNSWPTTPTIAAGTVTATNMRMLQ